MKTLECMILDIRKLQENEIDMLRGIRQEYKEFDRLDFLIAFTLKRNGISIVDFNNRIVEEGDIVETKPILVITPEAVKYCDGDKCVVTLGGCK